MKFNPLKIRHLEARFPVIQAGMGVRVSSAKMAAAVANAGGYGTIATVGIGFFDFPGIEHYVEHCNKQLAMLIRDARQNVSAGSPIGVNIMVALTNYREMVQTAVAEKVDFIISGAGLPLSLPELVGDADIALIPVVSSGRAFELLIKAWQRRYGRNPDAVIIEGPECGGHLGFSLAELSHAEDFSLERLLVEAKGIASRYNVPDLPMIAAGGIACRRDIERLIELGYSGVQVGTHFITAEEAEIAEASKRVFIAAGEEDLTVIQSPVGMPLRVIKNRFAERVLAGERMQFTCKYNCLRSCKHSQAPFCLAQALLATCNGDIDNALFMSGCNINAVKQIYPIRDFFRTLE